VPDTADDLAILIGRIAGGDRDAFQTLYDRTAAKLTGVALRIVKDRAVAEDVVQEAYLKVWQGAASYSPDAGRSMTWLISIARYRAIDILRARRETQLRTSEDGLDPLEGMAEGRDRETEFATSDQLRQCLERLDETQRRCLLAAYHEGLSREELAASFGRPVNTIKTWLHRSARALRGCLEEA
jgi:RNA polymerase sigma-70 factor (ECF subfamily)